MSRKRANGEGCITKRSDGRWMASARTSVGRLCFYGRTQAEVKVKLNEALEQYRKNIYIKPEKQTFGEWLDIWMKEYTKLSIRPTTYDSYEYLIRVHIKPGLGKVVLKDLKPSQIQKFYLQKTTQKIMDRRSDETIKKDNIKIAKGLMEPKKEKTISPATIKRMHAIISGSLEQALHENKIIRNPSDAVKPPKIERKEARYLESNNLKIFLDTIVNDRWYPAFILVLNTGVRLGELTALKWNSVDLEKGIVCIKEAVSWIRDYKNGGWQLNFHPPKSQKGLRSIPIPIGVVEIIKKLKQRQEQEIKLIGDAYVDKNQEFIFTWQDGRLVDPFYLSKHFSKLMRKCGLSLNFHGARHSYATALLQAGEHPKVVQELLGDSTIAVVLDTYSHVTLGLKERAVGKLDGVFMPTDYEATK